ncbi:MAG: hypothetical protein ACYDBY_01495 [Thermoanaerobaculia bacterium]
MKYELMLRSRARQEETIQEKHQKFIEGIRCLPLPWGSGDTTPMTPDPGRELVAEIRASQFLGKPVRGSVVYQFRRPFADEGIHDDHLCLTFGAKKVDYGVLVDEVLERYIDAFDAYRAHIGPDEFNNLDFDDARHIDYRRGVFRIYPVSFFDRDLCRRAFGLDPEQLADRVAPACKKVRLLKAGVLIEASGEVLDVEASRAVDLRLRQLIRNG